MEFQALFALDVKSPFAQDRAGRDVPTKKSWAMDGIVPFDRDAISQSLTSPRPLPPRVQFAITKLGRRNRVQQLGAECSGRWPRTRLQGAASRTTVDNLVDDNGFLLARNDRPYLERFGLCASFRLMQRRLEVGEGRPAAILALRRTDSFGRRFNVASKPEETCSNNDQITTKITYYWTQSESESQSKYKT